MKPANSKPKPHALETQMAYETMHDSLTKLPNRVLFFDLLSHALTQAALSNTHCAGGRVNLKEFKEVNEGLGRHKCDRILK